MPRETKRQREEREALERQQREDKERAEYPARVLAVLEACTEFNWTVRFKNGVVCVDYWGEDFPFHYNNATWEIGCVENRIQTKRTEIEEQKRKDALRESARAKMTDEERKAVFGY